MGNDKLISFRNWSVYKSSRGKLYYYDQVTGTSQWNVPEEFPPELWDIFSNLESENMSTPELKDRLTSLMIYKLKKTSLLDENDPTNEIQFEMDLTKKQPSEEELPSVQNSTSDSKSELKTIPTFEVEKCFEKILDCVEGSISTLEPIIKQTQNRNADEKGSQPLPLLNGKKPREILADCYSGIVDKGLYDTTLMLESKLYCAQYNYLKNRYLWD